MNAIIFETAPLPERLRDFLLAEIKDGRYKGLTRLPSEESIARDLRVSRPTVRLAMILLEKAGFIVRQRGVGTFINRKVLDLNARLDVEKDLADLLRDCGYQPAVQSIDFNVEQAGPKAAQKLNIPPTDEVLKMAKVWLADGKPLIYDVDRIPTALIRQEYGYEQLNQSIFLFLSQCCGEIVLYNITEIRPLVAGAELAQILGCTQGELIQMFEEVGFNGKDVPIIYSEEYYLDRYLRFKIVRTKI
ncbi:MAG: GntR family transcriptional regulator [Chloroflexi bacterium]|nr:GntR family transcriptional regulator [Chloroflexota bacterium]